MRPGSASRRVQQPCAAATEPKDAWPTGREVHRRPTRVSIMFPSIDTRETLLPSLSLSLVDTK